MGGLGGGRQRGLDLSGTFMSAIKSQNGGGAGAKLKGSRMGKASSSSSLLPPDFMAYLAWEAGGGAAGGGGKKEYGSKLGPNQVGENLVLLRSCTLDLPENLWYVFLYAYWGECYK